MGRGKAHPIVQQLHTYRVMIGQNITEVAERAGINRTTISQAELGHQDPHLNVVARWAAALGYRIELVDVEEERKPE